MENLLLMGIDTRPMVNSALKLDYKTFSISYFKTVDFKMPYMEKHVLDQESVISCGRFEENYSPEKLLELSKDFLFQNFLNYQRIFFFKIMMEMKLIRLYSPLE